jgi:hypothetical protein
MTTHETRGYRSIFWPMILIGVGVIWLLSNLEIIPGWSWWNLWRLWPLFLIAIGLDLLFARRSPILGALLGLVTIAAAVALLMAAPSLGLSSSAEVVTESFSEPIGSATTASLDLEFSLGRGTLDALSTGANLIEAEVAHVGTVRFTTSGESSKDIRLVQIDEPFNIGFDDFNGDQLRWDVGLTPQIPLELRIDCGVGEAHLDMSGIQLAQLDVQASVGNVDLILPATDEPYQAVVNGDVGRVQIEIEDGAAIDLEIQADVGDFVIDVPDGAAVHLEAETDIGSVRVPQEFDQLRSGEDQVVGESGTWETPGFSQATRQIRIVFNGDVSSLTIR